MKGREKDNVPEILNSSPSPRPSPVEDCVATGGKIRHSGEGRNPVFDFIQIFEILDARFRWHDELRHSLARERGGVRGNRNEKP